jgi:hypothetical protein
MTHRCAWLREAEMLLLNLVEHAFKPTLTRRLMVAIAHSSLQELLGVRLKSACVRILNGEDERMSGQQCIDERKAYLSASVYTMESGGLYRLALSNMSIMWFQTSSQLLKARSWFLLRMVLQREGT